MSLLENSTTLAARMGRWSARRRKTAIFAWLAFVAAAAVIGATLGTTQLDPDDIAVGESKRAQEILAAGGFADTADDSVLVTSEAYTAADPAFRAGRFDTGFIDSALAARNGRPFLEVAEGGEELAVVAAALHVHTRKAQTGMTAAGAAPGSLWKRRARVEALR